MVVRVGGAEGVGGLAPGLGPRGFRVEPPRARQRAEDAQLRARGAHVVLGGAADGQVGLGGDVDPLRRRCPRRRECGQEDESEAGLSQRHETSNGWPSPTATVALSVSAPERHA